MTNGYDFYFKYGEQLLVFPITPESLDITSGSNNETITLISEGEVNLLKSPSLTEIEFDARFPMRNYPYSREVSDFQSYYDFFKKMKEDKLPFRFIVSRETPNGNRTWDTNLLVALEEFKINENVENGDDVIVSFSLKQYKEYGIQYYGTTKTTSSAETSRSTDNKTSEAQSYTIKSGDTLWGIAKQYYGDGTKYPIIYNANKSIIEAEAKKYGYSGNGHWIFPGTKLTIPAI